MNRIVIGNVKMNLLYPRERDQYIANLKNEIRCHKLSKIDIVICPSFIHIESFIKNFSKNIFIGAQDIFWERKGAYTGEISPIMLKEMGCFWSIVGHSERRIYLKESEEMIQKKLTLSVKSGIKTVLCIGETLEERRGEQIRSVLERQIVSALNKIRESELKNVVIAYEPIWSIGTGITPMSNEIMEVALLIKRLILDLFGSGYEKTVPILYGGSVNTQNVRRVCLEPLMDGVLVGESSLHVDDFFRIASILDENI